MNLKDRTNLLNDSCARIPYGVKCQCLGRVGTIRSIDTFGNTEVEGFSGSIVIDVSHVRPYLFPLSSMTEEQRKEFLSIQSEERKILCDALIKYRYEKEDKIPIIASQKHIDWLIANHFDYRGLIPMGLAIDATGLNIY